MALQLIDQAPVWLTVAAATLTAIVTAAFLMSGPVAILAGRTGKKLPEVRGGYDAASLKGYVYPDQPSAPEAGFSLLDSDTFPRPIYDLLQKIKK